MLLDCLERNEKNGIVYHREGIMGDYDEFDDYDDESYETKPLPQTKNKKAANKKSSKKKYDIEFIDL